MTRTRTPGRPRPFDPVADGTVAFYRDAELYDFEFSRRRADVTFYLRLARRLDADRALDLGCGTGRVLVPLARAGVHVTGVDLSREMLARCAARIARAGAGRRSLLLRADLRALPVAAGAGYRLVLAAFNTVQHLYETAEFLAMLDGVRAALAPGGAFAFDVTFVDVRDLPDGPPPDEPPRRFRYPGDGRVYVYSARHRYDPVRQIDFMHLRYRPEDGGAARTLRLAHRVFFPREIEALLSARGFAIERREGGFSGQPLSSRARSQVVVARAT